jgi:hypothetical protein
MVFIPGKYANQPDEEWVSPNIIAIRKYQAAIDELNARPSPAAQRTTLAEVVAAVPTGNVSRSERAREWLRRVLEHGPVRATEVEQQAITDEIGSKALKTAKRKLKVQSVRKGRDHWVWQLPARAAPDDGRE